MIIDKSLSSPKKWIVIKQFPTHCARIPTRVEAYSTLEPVTKCNYFGYKVASPVYLNQNIILMYMHHTQHASH